MFLQFLMGKFVFFSMDLKKNYSFTYLKKIK